MVQAHEGHVEVPSARHTQRDGLPLSRTDGFDAFFEDVYPLLMKIAMAVGATVDEAEDAANETMAYLYQRWDGIIDPRAYARRVVVNSVVKTRKRDGERLRRTVADAHVTPAADGGTALSAWEDRQWVVQHLQALPPAQREVMACVVDDMSSAEIAAVLGKTATAVRKNLQWARERLRHELAEEQQRERLRSAMRDNEAGREGQ
jgi:RNA polymerase sigma factor (sigma-70 family)